MSIWRTRKDGIDAYGLLEDGRQVPDDLKARILGNRNGIGETMLHWYAIEGELAVVEKIIDLGFDVNTTNHFKQTPLFECVQIGRWDMVGLLLSRGADVTIKDRNDEDILEHLVNNGKRAKAAKLMELTSRPS